MVKPGLKWLLVISLLAVPTTSFGQFDPERAPRTYRALALVQKQLSDFASIELEELRQLNALVSAARRDDQETAPDCRKRDATSGMPSNLENAILDLKCSGHYD